MRPSRTAPAPTFPSSSTCLSSSTKLLHDGLALAGGCEPHTERKTGAQRNVKPHRASGPSVRTQGMRWKFWQAEEEANPIVTEETAAPRPDPVPEPTPKPVHELPAPRIEPQPEPEPEPEPDVPAQV